MTRISVTVDVSRALNRLGKLPDATRAAVRGEVVSLTAELLDRVRAKLSGEVLNIRSGDLLRSIHSQMEEGTTSIEGRVFSDGTVPYAAIHEYGGTTRPHVITARIAKALRFEMGGEIMFRKSVNHPGSKIPERSYLRSSLAEMQDEIVSRLNAAVDSSIKETA